VPAGLVEEIQELAVEAIPVFQPAGQGADLAVSGEARLETKELLAQIQRCLALGTAGAVGTEPALKRGRCGDGKPLLDQPAGHFIAAGVDQQVGDPGQVGVVGVSRLFEGLLGAARLNQLAYQVKKSVSCCAVSVSAAC
jgi:hypothetical protein